MDLKKDFNKFAEKKAQSSFKEKVSDIKNFIVLNKEKLDAGLSLAKAVTAYSIHKSPYIFVEAGLDVVKALTNDKSYFADDFFNETNGWKLVSHEGVGLAGIFGTVLKKFPTQTLKFEYDHKTSGKLVTLPFCNIGYVNRHGEEEIYYEPKKYNVEDILEFLVNEKMKELNTRIVSLGFSKKNDEYAFPCITLVPESIFPIDSLKADFYANYIRECLKLGYTRSIMFSGVPGTGKTSLAQTIVDKLGFKTLRFRYTDTYNFNIFSFIVKKFKIEAVIIDDFDQIEAKDQLLEFLEVLKKETKLVIGIVNSLHEFHPAILRPGRFDEIHKIDSLDENVVAAVLGSLKPSYLEKVKAWPIAYINELVTRSKIQPIEDLEKSYEELNERVKKQLDDLGNLEKSE